MTGFSVLTIPATSALAVEARRFEVRHDRIGGFVSPYAAESTYLVLRNATHIVGVARLVDPRRGTPYNDLAEAEGDMLAPAAAWEIASFNVAPRWALHSAGWVGLWAAVLAHLRSVGADRAVTILDRRTFEDLQTVSLKAMKRHGIIFDHGRSSVSVLAELDIDAYAAVLETNHPQSHRLYIKGEGLEDIVRGMAA